MNSNTRTIDDKANYISAKYGYRNVISSSDVLQDLGKYDTNKEDVRTYSREKNDSSIVSVFDVAQYIVKVLGETTTMKLQKLVYYCQAWSLVWDDKPLFKENIEAWVSGPVVKELFYYHKGQYQVSNIQIGNQFILSDQQKETIDAVLEFYGSKPSQWLVALSHQEEPWLKARKGLDSNDRGNRVIKLDDIASYYSSL